MHFIQLNSTCSSELSDMLIAELAELGFDSFEENNQGFSAYVEEDKMDFEETKALMERYSGLGPISYALQKIERQNWNEEWEKNFPPIVVDDQILVRAPFHQVKESYPVEILITPKMSFGTGHHATTSQMLKFILRYSPMGLSVLDAGSGTGILAIMAEKAGAESVLAFDNDPWCIKNATENFDQNQCQHCRVELANSLLEIGGSYQMILANINKNVLLAEMKYYGQALQPGGWLLLSGFYEEDIADLQTKAAEFGLQLIDQSAQNLWACLVFTPNKKPINHA